MSGSCGYLWSWLLQGEFLNLDVVYSFENGSAFYRWTFILLYNHGLIFDAYLGESLSGIFDIFHLLHLRLLFADYLGAASEP